MYRVVLSLFLFCTVVNGYRFLIIYPTGITSHQKVQQVITNGLLEKGHHVTLIAPNNVEPQHPNVTHIDIAFTYEYIKLLDLSKSIDLIPLLDVTVTFVEKTMDNVLSYKPVKDILQNIDKIKYDAILVELFYYTPILITKRIFNATLIGFSSLEFSSTVHEVLGNAVHPVLHPSFLLGVNKNPTFYERIKIVYMGLYYKYWINYGMFAMTDRLIQKHFPHIYANSWDLIADIDFAIEGLTPVLGNVRPLVSNTIQVGFVHVKQPKPLPYDLQKFLDNSNDGVIYVSFGSNVKSALLQPALLNTLIETFRQVKYNILWKYENDTLNGKPDNVLTSKWFPQSDLLAHKNVKLFIMQGGQQSLDESIARRVPVIVIPFFADQDANAEKVQTTGIGLRLLVKDVTTEALKNQIHEIMRNDRYRINMEKLNNRINDTPMAPLDTVIWWIEYAIRNQGAEHLKYQGAKMSFIEYYLLDVIFIHLVIFVLTLKILLVFIKFCIKRKNKEKMN